MTKFINLRNRAIRFIAAILVLIFDLVMLLRADIPAFEIVFIIGGSTLLLSGIFVYVFRNVKRTAFIKIDSDTVELSNFPKRGVRVIPIHSITRWENRNYHLSIFLENEIYSINLNQLGKKDKNEVIRYMEEHLPNR